MSKTISELSEEYLQFAEADPERLREEFLEIDRYSREDSPCIYHGEYVRTTYMPKLFRRSDFERLSSDIGILYGIFEKIFERFFSDEAYRVLFGFGERELGLVLGSRHREFILPMARVDIFYNEETGDYKFCEFNTDGTSAMNEDRALNMGQQGSTAYSAFVNRYNAHSLELFDSWVRSVIGMYRSIRGTDSFRVAIVDYLEGGLVHEFHEFARHFEAAGIETEICDVRDLAYDGETLTGKSGKRIDAIYRRAVTSDVLAHFEESQAMIRAAAEDKVVLFGDFHTQLVHNKSIFRVMQSPETFDFLNEEEIAYIRKHVPGTRSFTEADRKTVAENRTAWILKPIDSYASRGVYAGVEYDDEKWVKIVNDIPAEGYLLQEFYMPYVTKNYGLLKGVYGKRDYYNLTGIYVYNSVPAGFYSRVSASPIISTQYSELTVPTLLVEDM